MSIHRCPECGARLQTNYCDICMRKVPFAGARPQKYRDPWEMSSAHREEAGHKCITFDVPATPSKKQTFTKPKTTFTKPTPAFPKRKPAQKKQPKVTTVVAIVLAILSLLPSLFGLLEDVHIDNPKPGYDVEAFVMDGQMPAMDAIGIYSNGQIEIIAESLGLYYDEPAISFVIDNLSDSDMDVVVESVAVNGYMLNAGMSARVDAGDSSQAFLSFYSYYLDESYISEIAWVDLRLRIYDCSNYNEIAYVDMVTIETDIADTYPQPATPDGWEMIREDGLSVRLLDTQLPGQESCELSLYLENLTEDTVNLYSTATYVNGEEAEGGFWITLLPGTCALQRVYISDLFDLNLEDVSEITEIDLSYSIEVADGDNLLDLVEGSVLFNPNALPTSD